jgi:hypothetical protein
MVREWVAPWAVALCAGLIAGCGLQAQAPDLFLLTRIGAGQQQTLLVNSGGTVRCNGSGAKPLPDRLLLQARRLTGTLNRDARRHLHLAPRRGSVYSYRVKLQSGTITFPDTAGRTHPELAQLELLAVQILGGPCQGQSHRAS